MLVLHASSDTVLLGTNQGELTAEDFEWLSKEHIFVLVYLVTMPTLM